VAMGSEAWICSSSLSGAEGSNPAGGMDVCLLRALYVVRSLCDGLITRSEGSYRLWCVWVWSWRLDEEARAH